MSVVRTPRRLMGRLYRACAAPFGLRALDGMLRDGLPPRLHSPLRFLFTGEAPGAAENVAARIERLRADIASREDTYQFSYRPTSLGTARWPERAGGSSTGACVGISGAYLTSVPSHPRFLTLEGSAALAPIAHETLAALSHRAVILHGPFETGLHRAFAAFADEHLPVDVAYIDGHHDEAATLHYVRSLAPHLASEALVILDDIYLYAEMWRAWQRVRSMRGLAAAATQYDLARYTGWWRVGGSRRAALRA